MVRLLGAIGVAAIALLQSVVALAAPTPSPALDGILLSPPGTSFVEADKNTPGIFEGAFDSAGYATITSSTNGAQAKQTLDGDGFLSGYGRTWVSQSTHHIYVEAVMAFVGGSGAKTWLGQSELADKAESTYQHSITISGVGTYYGARLVDSVNSVYADAYVFLKGNDTYLVSTVSTSDDLATTAATQAKRQYDSAPPYTVPPSEWPEAKAASAAFSVGKIVGEALFVILIVALIGGTVLFVRSRRRPALVGVPVYGGAVSAPIPPAVQMSEDRGSWWDGTTWRDAAHEVPPHAQLSDDGKFWWDGQTWRAIPSPPTG
jgi:hypothetical protein